MRSSSRLRSSFSLRSSSRLRSSFSLALLPALTLLAQNSTCQSNQTGLLTATELGDLSAGLAPRARFGHELEAACGVPGLGAHGEAVIDRAPYLQQVTERSALLLWTASQADGQLVELTRPDGTLLAQVPAEVDPSATTSPSTQYLARLAALEPATTYCYRLRDSQGELTQRTGFRTAASEGSTRFVVFSDLGSGKSDQQIVASQLKTVDFDLALLGGDVSQLEGQLSQYEAYVFDVYDELMRSAPFFPAAGNHDHKTGDAGPFRQVFALFENGAPAGLERWYSFDWGPLHVVVLDSEQTGPEQAAWLDDDLARSARPWRIAVLHRPPYSSGNHGGDAAVREHFVPLFIKHHVDVVFSGHDHDYERSRPLDGVTYIVTGGGGMGTRPVGFSAETAFSEQVSHFIYGVADAEQLTLWAIDANGNTFDSLRLPRPRTKP